MTPTNDPIVEARALTAKGWFREAETLLYSCLRLEPKNAPALDALVELCMAAEDFARAVDALAALGQVDGGLAKQASSRHGGFLTSLADQLMDMERAEDAERILSSLVSAGSGGPKQWLLLARCRIRLHRMPEALEALERGLAVATDNPELADLHLERANLLSAAGSDLEAAEEAEQAVQAFPFYRPDLHHAYARLLQKAGREKEANWAFDWAARHETFLQGQIEQMQADPTPRYDRPEANLIASPAIWNLPSRPGFLVRLFLFCVCLALLAKAAGYL